MWQKLKSGDISGLKNSALSKANILPGLNKLLGSDKLIVEKEKTNEVHIPKVDEASEDLISAIYYKKAVEGIFIEMGIIRRVEIKHTDDITNVHKSTNKSDQNTRLKSDSNIQVPDNKTRVEENTNIDQQATRDMESSLITQTALSELQQQYQIVLNENRELKELVNHNTEMNEHLEQEIKELRREKAKFSKTEAENAYLLKSLKEFEGYKAKFDASESQMVKYSQDMSKKLNELVEKNSQLENLKKTANAEISEKAKTIKEKEDKIKSLTKELDGIKVKAEKKDQSIVDLQMQMETMKKDLMEANSRIKEKGLAKENELNASIKKLKDDIKAKEESLKESKDKIIQGDNQKNR